MVVRVCGAHGGGRGEPTGDAARHIASGRRCAAARCAKIDLWIPRKRFARGFGSRLAHRDGLNFRLLVPPPQHGACECNFFRRPSQARDLEGWPRWARRTRPSTRRHRARTTPTPARWARRSGPRAPAAAARPTRRSSRSSRHRRCACVERPQRQGRMTRPKGRPARPTRLWLAARGCPGLRGCQGPPGCLLAE